MQVPGGKELGRTSRLFLAGALFRDVGVHALLENGGGYFAVSAGDCKVVRFRRAFPDADGTFFGCLSGSRGAAAGGVPPFGLLASLQAP